MRQFFFDTGVTFSGGNADLIGNQVWREGTKQIPFYCEDVPEGSILMFACADLDSPESKLNEVIVRKIHHSDLLSKYAYFRIPLV